MNTFQVDGLLLHLPQTYFAFKQTKKNLALLQKHKNTFIVMNINLKSFYAAQWTWQTV